jgi:hypothetical protein
MPVKRRVIAMTVCWVASLIAGCAKPDVVKIIQSPKDGLYLSIETFQGHGPVSSDDTAVYVRLHRNGEADKQRVLSGENLSITAAWTGPDTVTLCLAEGITAEYRNEVTVRANNGYETVHVLLKDKC